MSSIESQLMKLVDYIGFYGPIIMIVLVTFGLWGRTKYLIFFLLFFIANYYFNEILKSYIKEPRPAAFNSTQSPTLKYEYFANHRSYGMPSGHAQDVFYSLIFLFLAKTQFTVYSVAGIFVSAITVFQRFKTKRHSAKQLAAGAVVGGAVAYLAQLVASHMVIGGCA